MSHLPQLALASNSNEFRNKLSLCFDSENDKDLKEVHELQNMAQELCTRVKERGELICQLHAFNLSHDAFESLKLIKQLQEHDMAKTRSPMKAITKIHRHVNFVSRVLPNKVGVKVTNLDLVGVIEDEKLFGDLSDEDAVRGCLLLSLEDDLDFSQYFVTLSKEFCAELKKEFIELTGSPLFGIFPSRQDQNSEDDVLKTKQEESWRLQEQKMMEEVFVKRLKEEVMLRVEKEKLVNYEREENKRKHALMNSDHWKAYTSRISNCESSQCSSDFLAYYWGAAYAMAEKDRESNHLYEDYLS
ncbi:hypothetical protein Tco_0898609 [Tanacetum coccineum]